MVGTALRPQDGHANKTRLGNHVGAVEEASVTAEIAWWTLGAVLWLVCGVLAYGIEFAWHVGLCESYSLAGNNDEMLRDGQITGAVVGMFGPIGLIMAVGATRAVRLPRQSRRVRWRNP